MEVLKEDIRKIILFTPVPKPEDLCCFLCKLNPLSPGSNSFKLTFRWKILKCRMLIFSEPRIIASPVYGMDNQIYIIMSKDFYKTGKIQSHFDRIGINAGRSVRVTKSAYEACLRYTVLARIAPLWNQVGSYLVKGRNFLLLKKPLFAIMMDVILTGKEMSLIIWPYRLHIYNITLEELLNGNEGQLSNLSEVQINEGKWVYVLPSLQKAQVLSISKSIPAYCTFTSYKQLKRHWKNNYGYRIPEDEECLFYVTVTFGNNRPTLGVNGWSGQVYIYPGPCVCICPPVVLRCIDQTTPIKTFLDDLSVRVPQVCGHPFAGDQAELGYAAPKLNLCENEVSSVDRMKMKDFFPCTPALKGLSHVPVDNLKFLTHSTFPSAESFINKKLETPVLKDVSQNYSNNDDYASIYAKNGFKPSYPTDCNQTEKKENVRYAPVFRCKSKTISSKSKLSSDGGRKDQVNSQNKTINKSKKGLCKLKQGKALEVNGNDKKEGNGPKGSTVKLLNCSLPKKSIGVHSKTIIMENNGKSFNSTSSEKSKDDIMEIKDFNARASQNMAQSNESSNFLNPLQIGLKQSDVLARKNMNVTHPLGNKSNTLKTKRDQIVPNDKKKDTCDSHYFTMEFGLLDDGKSDYGIVNQQNISTSDLNDVLKYPPVSDGESATKKYYPSSTFVPCPMASNTDNSGILSEINRTDSTLKDLKKKATTSRSRPVIQAGIDVGALAKDGLLSRANTTTLISWLRARGVTCRVKDKKSDLVCLVEAYLGLPPINGTTLGRSIEDANKYLGGDTYKGIKK